MPRIRSVKPEYAQHHLVSLVSIPARLVHVLLRCHCDDGGNHLASTRRVRLEVFPGDPMSDDDVGELIDELVAVGLLVPYTAVFDGKPTDFWHDATWSDQRVDKPNPVYPPPPAPGTFDEHSENVLGMVAERSGLIGKDRTGKDQTRSDQTGPEEAPPSGGEVPGDGKPAKADKAKPPKPTAAEVEIPPVLNTPEFRHEWGRWLKYRKGRRLSCLVMTLEGQLEDLARDGPARAVETIKRSINSGWAGLFPDGARANGNGTARNGGRVYDPQGAHIKAPTEVIPP
ncbi:MAG: hypothetical protein AB7U73_05120 [Pirellulales bacterium]